MQTTLLSLLGIYVSLGGELTDTYEDIADGIAVCDYVTIPDALQAVAKLSGSTLELPKVSSADNGDLLTVVSGKWKKAEPAKELPAVTAADEGSILAVNSSGEWDKADAPSGGGGKIYTCETAISLIAATQGQPGTVTFDNYTSQSQAMTDIIADLDAGKNVLIQVRSSITGMPPQPTYIELSPVYRMSSNGVRFCASYMIQTTVLHIYVEVYTSNNNATVCVV